MKPMKLDIDGKSLEGSSPVSLAIKGSLVLAFLKEVYALYLLKGGPYLGMPVDKLL